MSLNRFIESVYEHVFRATDAESEALRAGNQDEFQRLVEANVDRYFAPSYRQETNVTGYDRSQFIAHVATRKSGPAAKFAIEIFTEKNDATGHQACFRAVVTDAASDKVVSLVLSFWELERTDGENLAIVRNRELTFAPPDPLKPEDTGTLLDPTTWKAVIRVPESGSAKE